MIIDFIKKFILFFFSSKPGWRDKNGRIIDDRKRRAHIKKTRAKIESGEITLPDNGGIPRCYKVQSNGKVIIETISGQRLNREESQRA